MSITQSIERLGRTVRVSVSQIGNFTLFFLRLLSQSGIVLRRPRLLTQQVHFIGNHSLLIIVVSGLFVGFVLGLQGYYTLNRYGSEEALGLLVALSLTRELGPVVTALLFAGRAGTSLTAEIGLMKAGEQLAAMEVMAVDPVRRVLAPRLWGGIIAMPVLAAVFSMVGIIGGWVVGVLLIGVDAGAFWSQMQDGVDVWKDVMNGVLKSVVFGLACHPNARGCRPGDNAYGGDRLTGCAGLGFCVDSTDVRRLRVYRYVEWKNGFLGRAFCPDWRHGNRVPGLARRQHELFFVWSQIPADSQV